jgi:hypothetical protein
VKTFVDVRRGDLRGVGLIDYASVKRFINKCAAEAEVDQSDHIVK